MSSRANYLQMAPKAIQILIAQEKYLAEQFDASSVLSNLVWSLVKLRVSQMNQCAFCIDMHSKELLELNQSLERILGLSAWRDMPFYSQVERVALKWCERITAAKPIDDYHYQQSVDTLGENNLVNLTIAVNAINSWNRIAKTFRPEVGSYKN